MFSSNYCLKLFTMILSTWFWLFWISALTMSTVTCFEVEWCSIRKGFWLLCCVWNSVSRGENKKNKFTQAWMFFLLFIYLLAIPHSLWDLTDLANNFVRVFPLTSYVGPQREFFVKLNSSLIRNWTQALGSESMSPNLWIT